MALFQKLIMLSLILSLVSCIHKIEDRTWTVPLPDLPSKILIKDYTYNRLAIILKLIHQPLFKRQNKIHFTSEHLSSWRRSLDGINYRFCLKKPITIHSDLNYDLNDLKNLIVKIGSKEKIPFSQITTTDSCVLVTLQSKSNRLLRALSLLKYSPVKIQSNGFEGGLGPYYIESIEDHRIRLVRKKITKNGFNSVDFIDSKLIKQGKVDIHSIEDFNFTPHELRPNWLSSRFSHYKLTQLRSVVLLINSNDKLIRRAIYSCINIDKIIAATKSSTTNIEYPPISTVLPVGVQGGHNLGLSRNCSPIKKGYKHQPLTFVFYNGVVANKLQTVFKALSVKSGVKIISKFTSPNKLVQATFDRDYGLALVSLDSLDESHVPFFEPFFDSKSSLYSQVDSEGSSDLSKLKLAENTADKLKYVIKLRDRISNNYLALPLYQVVRGLLYPKYIKNLSVGSDLTDFPNIAELKLK